MGRRRKKHGECVYCGRPSTLTDDHIPPEALFAKDDRRNLIKVPCCLRCHVKTSRDDEYFKNVLTLREDVADHPDVRQVLPSVLRSFRVPHNTELKLQLLKSVTVVNPKTPAGLILPGRPAFTVDLVRIERVVERVVKGLFFHEKGHRLPDDHIVAAYSAEKLVDQKGNLSQDLAGVLNPVLVQSPKSIGREVFTYKFLCATDDPHSSAWLLVFYKKVLFAGLTLPLPTLGGVLQNETAN